MCKDFPGRFQLAIPSSFDRCMSYEEQILFLWKYINELEVSGLVPNITANATVDETTGQPNVKVTKSGTETNPVFTFAFTGIKGEQGEQGQPGEAGAPGAPGEAGAPGVTPSITANATVDNTTGVPTVTVRKSGTDEAPMFTFEFSGIKGEKGEKGEPGQQGEPGAPGAPGEAGAPGENGVTPTINAVATVDDTSGIPDVVVTKSGTDTEPTFTFAFSGLKGEAGAYHSLHTFTHNSLTSANSPIRFNVVNNRLSLSFTDRNYDTFEIINGTEINAAQQGSLTYSTFRFNLTTGEQQSTFDDSTITYSTVDTAAQYIDVDITLMVHLDVVGDYWWKDWNHVFKMRIDVSSLDIGASVGDIRGERITFISPPSNMIRLVDSNYLNADVLATSQYKTFLMLATPTVSIARNSRGSYTVLVNFSSGTSLYGYDGTKSPVAIIDEKDMPPTTWKLMVGIKGFTGVNG